MNVIEEGNAAQRLLKDPVLKAVIDEMRRTTYEQWCQMPANREHDLLRLKLFAEAVTFFESALTTKVQAMEKQRYEDELKSKEQ